MALSEDKVREYRKRLLAARMRILCNHGFYGLLLMHMIYSIDEGAETAYTDGERIAFGPKFLDELSDSELDFIMMHEILHVVLQHCLRGDVDDPERYNIAADIVVNSNIMLENDGKPSSITLLKYGESMHIAPDGKEGYLYTAEEVYEMLAPMKKNEKHRRWDDHTQWSNMEDNSVLRDVWVKHFAETCEAVTVRESANSRGILPMFAKRMLERLRRPQTDWRSMLNDFIQEEINDYSFLPPDRRFQDNPFFLPDFNENGESDVVEDILFMIDTSGSISDKMMTAAYSEVKGAIDQFNGKLCGWLGFFDAAIIEPKPFSNFEEFSMIKPAGGGGTDFQIIFEYVNQHMQENPPASIIILTDGYAPFPKEEMANGLPVLWLINNERVNPPWGRVARIKV